MSGHINIVQFTAAASIGKEESGHGQAEFLILTELCTGLYDVCCVSLLTGCNVNITFTCMHVNRPLFHYLLHTVVSASVVAVACIFASLLLNYMMVAMLSDILWSYCFEN